MDSSTVIDRVRVWHIGVPLEVPFSHARASRVCTNNFVVEVLLVTGERGYGEAIPRAYLTGETDDDVIARASEWATDIVRGATLSTFDDAVGMVQRLRATIAGKRGLAALAGFEVAILDAAGRAFGCAVGDAIGPARAHSCRFTGSIDTTIDFCSAAELDGVLSRVREVLEKNQWCEVKVKVGRAGDVERLARIRSVLGADVDIRVDANGAWSGQEAVECMKRLRDLGVVTVEQPCAAGDLDGMRRVRLQARARVVADESLCSLDDLYRLIDAEACDLVNIRLLKCGGLLACKELFDVAGNAGLGFQYNGLIGETGIAEAASRHYLSRVGATFEYVAGGSQRARFENCIDVIAEDLRVDGVRSGSVPMGPGLGVTVDVEKLDRWAKRTHVF